MLRGRVGTRLQLGLGPGGALQWGVQGTGSLKGCWSLSSAIHPAPRPPPPLHPVPGEAGSSTCQERVERIWASRVSLRSYLTEGGKGRVSSTDNGPEKARKTRSSQAGAGQSHLSHKALVPALEAPGRWGGHRSTALVPLTSEPACAPFFPACADPACHSRSCSRLTPSLGPFPINPAHADLSLPRTPVVPESPCLALSCSLICQPGRIITQRFLLWGQWNSPGHALSTVPGA